MKPASSSTRLNKEDFPLWPLPIAQPYAGPMLGNTTMGLMLWGGEDHTVTLALNRADFWSRQGGSEWVDGQSYQAIRTVLEAGDAEALGRIFVREKIRPTLLPLGHITLRFSADTVPEKAALDIHQGLLTVTVRKAARTSNFSICLDWATGAIALSFPAGLRPAIEITPAWYNRNNAEQFSSIGATEPYQDPAIQGFVQTLPHDPSCALALIKKGGEAFVASLLADPSVAPAEALARAVKSAEVISELGAETLRTRTAERWASFWAKTPTLDLPNPVLQRLYEFGMYKFGAYSSSEPGSTPCTLQGPWYDDRTFPPWSGDYHFNINIQECYWPAFRGNHVEHLMPMFDMVQRWTKRLRENARVFVGIDDGLMLSHAVDDTGKAISAGFWTGMMDHGSTLWIADLLWQYYRFTGDLKWLRSRAVPFMKGAFNVFYKMLDRDSDGSLVLAVGPSPEYRGADMDAWGRNASFQLAAAHRLVENLLDAAALLNDKPDPRWEDVHTHLPKAALVPYADRQAIGLWEGLTLEESHRHHSHMASIFPFDTIDCEDPQWRDIVDCTFRRWMEAGSSAWSGWCVPWASILHTRVGNAEMAEMLLEIWERFYTNEGHGTLHDPDPSGFSYLGRSATPDPNRRPNEIMQLDAGGSSIEAIFEMLVHDRRGVTYLFRGAPKRWRDVSFQNILAPGNVLLSANRSQGTVGTVTLQAQSQSNKTTFRLANPWPNHAVCLKRESSRESLSGDILEIPLLPGETLRLSPIQE